MVWEDIRRGGEAVTEVLGLANEGVGCVERAG